MTLFCDESTISEEVPIDYENKVAIKDSITEPNPSSLSDSRFRPSVFSI